MMHNTTKLIHTKLYSKAAYEIISSVFGQLSDGYWENSPRMGKYWRYNHAKRSADGEVVISVENNWNNGFSEMSDDQILSWIADKIKFLAKDEDKVWKRNAVDNQLDYLSYDENVSTADAYLTYEILKGREITESKYDKSVIDKIVGVKRSAASVKVIIEKTKTLEDLVSSRDLELKAHDESYEAAKRKLMEDSAKIRQGIYDKYRDQIKTLETELKSA